MFKRFLFLYIILFLYIVPPQKVIAADTTHIAVNFKSNHYELHGKLIMPQVSEHQKPVPALIFLVGSGGAASYRTGYKEFLSENLEQNLLKEKIALFYFDKRGVGPSEGDWYKTDFYERAADVKAAIDFLKTCDVIDSQRVGVVGHSQGGWIAQIVAARYPEDVAFMASLAGPTFSVKKQLVNDYASGFICEGMNMEKAVRKAKRLAALSFSVVSVLPFNEQWKQLRLIRKFEPSQELQAIKCPALFLFAGADPLVSAGWSMEELNQLFPKGIPAHFSCKTIEHANHVFKLTNDMCYNGAWDTLQYAPEFQETLKNWILDQL